MVAPSKNHLIKKFEGEFRCSIVASNLVVNIVGMHRESGMCVVYLSQNELCEPGIRKIATFPCSWLGHYMQNLVGMTGTKLRDKIVASNSYVVWYAKKVLC